MLLYFDHCGMSDIYVSNSFSRIVCPVCNKLVKPQSLKQLQRLHELEGDYSEKIVELKEKVLSISEKKFESLKKIYERANEETIQNLLTLTEAFCELERYDAARNCARLLGIIYLYRGYNSRIVE